MKTDLKISRAEYKEELVMSEEKKDENLKDEELDKVSGGGTAGEIGKIVGEKVIEKVVEDVLNNTNTGRNNYKNGVKSERKL
ncbi:MAG: hypothetical protein RHS_2717 [Robinsoniella sp. RHS]|nr:MAG: hypothetical protein RHS_2717 [Robinsoniella sp. RHS]